MNSEVAQAVAFVDPEILDGVLDHEVRIDRLPGPCCADIVQRIGGIVGVVALTPEHNVVLVEQYRVPVGARVVELPAGLAGDTPELVALEVVTEAMPAASAAGASSPCGVPSAPERGI